MKRVLVSLVLLTTVVFSEDFEQFLHTAIKQNPYLKSSSLTIEQTKEEGARITRYKNPSVDLELSRFSPDRGKSDNGFRVNVAQPIRLWEIGNDKQRLAQAMQENATLEYRQKKAIFIRSIAFAYTRYVKQKMLNDLSSETLDIAEKIYEISKARYGAGTISRGLLLQSKMSAQTAQAQKESMHLAQLQSYYALLSLAGINKEIQIDTTYQFMVSKKTKELQNPELLILNSQQKKALSQVAVNTNKIEWINLFAEYEKEPQQDIYRVGITLPLAVFNTKLQEKRIAELESSKAKLLITNKTRQLNIQIHALVQQREILLALEQKNKKILLTQKELLEMFEKGYKIANIKLLELQNIKNTLIQTKKELINITTALNQNAILTNYIQGSYNE